MSVIHSLRCLEALGENWDNYGSYKPKKESIENALNFLNKLKELDFPLLNSLNITADEEGDIVIEFWTKIIDDKKPHERKISFYVSEKIIGYMKYKQSFKGSLFNFSEGYLIVEGLDRNTYECVFDGLF